MRPEPTPAPAAHRAATVTAAAVSLALEALRPGPSVREQLDADHVAVLAEVLDRLPPILVRADSLEIVDGAHRVAAARHHGREHIAAVLVDLDDDHAALAAHIRANTAHGLALTLAERRTAARALLRGDPPQSDRSIARICGLSPTTVGAVRRHLVDDGELPEVACRCGADGKTYPTPHSAAATTPAGSPRRGWWHRLLTRLRALIRRLTRPRDPRVAPHRPERREEGASPTSASQDTTQGSTC